MIDRLILPPHVAQHLFERARLNAPQEIVGILAGTAQGHVTDVFELPNIAGPGTHVAEPRAQYDAERQIRDRQLTWLAVYHSHPGGGTDPSPLDIAFSARRPGLAHLIVAVDRPTTHDALAAYRAVGGRTEQVALRIDDS